MERRWFFVAFLGLVLASLAPLFVNPYPALVDLACNSASAAVWHHLRDPDWNFAEYYDLSVGPAPYYAYFFLVRVLALPFGFLWATRFVVVLAIVAPPLVGLLITERFGRSPWLSLFTFPLIWTLSFYWGFLAFCLGIVVACLGLIAFDRFCERYEGWVGVAAIALGTLTMFMHLLPWGFWGGGATLLALLHRGRSARALLARGLAIAPGALIGAAVILRGSHQQMGSVGKLAFKFYDLKGHLTAPLQWVWFACADRHDLYAGMALLGIALLMRLTSGRPRWSLHDARITVVGLFAFVLYFAMPRSALQPIYWWGINIRFAVVALYFFVLCTPGRIVGWRRWLLAPVVGIGLWFAVDATLHWRRAAEYAAGFDTLAAIPPRQARVLVLVFPPEHAPDFNVSFMRAFPSYYQLQKGGYFSFSFDNGLPMVYRKRYPAPDWSVPTRWKPEKHARYYDYFLFFNWSGPGPVFGGANPLADLVGKQGRWQLWKLRGPRTEESPVAPYPARLAYE